MEGLQLPGAGARGGLGPWVMSFFYENWLSPLCFLPLCKECGVWCLRAMSLSLNLSAITVPDFSPVMRVVKSAK